MDFFHRGYIGLDIGVKSIKAVEMVVKASQVHVTKSGMIETPSQAYDAGRVLDPPLLAKTIKELWRKIGLKRKKPVLIAIGGPRVFYRILSIPVLPKKELLKALKWELGDYFPFSGREAVYDCLSLKDDRRVKGEPGKYLVVALEREVVVGYLETLSLAGLEARVLEPKPLALLRTLTVGEPGKGDKVSLHIMIEEGYLGVIFSSGEKILFIRVVPWKIGGPTCAQGSASGREILTECKNTFQYYSGRGLGPRPQQIVLFELGDSTNHCHLEKLAQEFHLPVRRPMLLNGNKLNWNREIAAEELSLFATCLGLGLREVGGNSGH